MLGRLHEHLAALRFRQPIAVGLGAHELGRVLESHRPQGLDALRSDDDHVLRDDDRSLHVHLGHHRRDLGRNVCLHGSRSAIDHRRGFNRLGLDGGDALLAETV